MATFTEVIVFEVLACANCGVGFGLTKDFEQRRRDDHKTFWCPAGHPNFFRGSSEAEELRAKLRQAEGDSKWYRDAWKESQQETARAENSLRTTKGHLTRLKNRAERGVCIHCNRTFADLSRHMEAKHHVENGHHDNPAVRP